MSGDTWIAEVLKRLNPVCGGNMIVKADYKDLQEILRFQYLAYQSEAVYFRQERHNIRKQCGDKICTVNRM